MEDEYLTRCVVNPAKRSFSLFSNEGDEKVVSCDTTEEFMNVLEFVRDNVSDDVLSYVNPL
tara:strand:+ start:1579 stop:1761 length:183 start_codon:yes stop_codon:yes gene_type:complete